MCKKIFCMNLVAIENVGEKPEGSFNVYPNNQSCTEKHYAALVIQRFKQITLLCNESRALRKMREMNMTKKMGSILRYRELTPCVVCKKN